MNVRFHPEASVDLEEATRWYNERSPFTSIAFLQAVQIAISHIQATPERFPSGDYETRKLVLKRFPFSIIYVLEESGIAVIAVAHQRRRSGYWSTRLVG